MAAGRAGCQAGGSRDKQRCQLQSRRSLLPLKPPALPPLCSGLRSTNVLVDASWTAKLADYAGLQALGGPGDQASTLAASDPRYLVRGRLAGRLGVCLLTMCAGLGWRAGRGAGRRAGVLQ